MMITVHSLEDTRISFTWKGQLHIAQQISDTDWSLRAYTHKTNSWSRVPLVSEVGTALYDYLKDNNIVV
jgi:hypothetical protein